MIIVSAVLDFESKSARDKVIEITADILKFNIAKGLHGFGIIRSEQRWLMVENISHSLNGYRRGVDEP